MLHTAIVILQGQGRLERLQGTSRKPLIAHVNQAAFAAVRRSGAAEIARLETSSGLRGSALGE